MKRIIVASTDICAALIILASQLSIAQTAALPASTQAKSKVDVIIPKAKRTNAPDFTLLDAKGQPLTLSALKGKVVFLDFWATWCGGCKTEIPWYVEFDQKYRNKGLAVVGVSMDDEGMRIVKPFLAKNKIEYSVIVGNDGLAKQYNLTAMPMTLLIDRDGRIGVSHTGVVDKRDFESHIQALLKERAVSTALPQSQIAECSGRKSWHC